MRLWCIVVAAYSRARARPAPLRGTTVEWTVRKRRPTRRRAFWSPYRHPPVRSRLCVMPGCCFTSVHSTAPRSARPALPATHCAGRARTRAAASRVRCAAAAMAPQRVCKAALFDLDGTLLDIEPLSTEAINKQCALATRHATPLCAQTMRKCSRVSRAPNSIEPLGGHCDVHLKRKILGKRAADWTRIVICASLLHGARARAAAHSSYVPWRRRMRATGQDDARRAGGGA